MIMREAFLLLLALVLLGCAKNKQSAIGPKAYYDLDSLLDAQIEMLSEEDVLLRKSVEMDGKQEQNEKKLDSAGWGKEFLIIRDFDLNKPNNVGAYSTEKSNGDIKYTLTANIDAPVKAFDVIKKEGNLSQITSNYFEDKSIYQHRRKMTLKFDNGLLRNYEVRGFQKMILKDTIKYIISGEVVKQ